jgi:type III secretion protein U
MSNDQTAEEKTLAPSSRKLRELRRKGYVARSPEMVAAVVLAVSFVYLVTRGHTFVDGFRAAIEEISRQDTDEITIGTSQVFKRIALGIGVFVAVLYAIVIMSTIVTSILASGGLIFSVNHVKFNISNLSPIEGFKRIFSLKTAVDLTKKIVNIIIFSIFSVIILASYVNEPFYIPNCGLSCFKGILGFLITSVLFVVVVLLLFAGLLDIGIQRWLFQRQHRMTKSEAKRDRKEEDGAPEVKSYRKRLRHGILQSSRIHGPADATIIIEGDDSIVGVRFVRGDTPIPVIVCKGKGNQLYEIANIALENKIPKYFDEDLASGLYRTHDPGAHLGSQYFEPFIKALVATGLV